MPHGRPAKRRRLTPPLNDGLPSETIQASDLFDRAADWDLEQDYELRKRQTAKHEPKRLPIKNADGQVETVIEDEASSEGNFLGSGSEGEDGDETPATDISEEPAKVVLKEEIIAVKEELARLATLINEDPEEHTGSFKRIGQFGEPQHHSSIRKLAFATQVAVYKDVIPGYRIRNYNDEDLGAKVSKDVRKTRQYEQSLISGYRAFISQLADVAKTKVRTEEGFALRGAAISCVCALLTAVPHFNFRGDLLNVIVRELAGQKATANYVKCIESVEAFFDEDEDGAPSFEAVTLLTKMMKAKDYRIRDELLNTFSHLRLLLQLSREPSGKRAERSDSRLKLHGRNAKKQKWEHRSKKERKVAKERKIVEKDMKEADATVDYEERDKLQSETLKLVFATYFRILKARTSHLMGAVLEGLAKYAHLINQDLFGDLLEVLRELIEHAERSADEGEDQHNPETEQKPGLSTRNLSREALLSTQTAFTLLSNQETSKSSSALHLDLSFFTAHTYRTLHPLALDPTIEISPRLPHTTTASSTSKNAINLTTPALLLTRILHALLLPTASLPAATPVTAAAYFKRLLTICLQTPEKSTLALLSLLAKLTDSKHARTLEPLWYSEERKGDGVYRGESESVEGANVFAVGSGVWEGELLRRHYVPGVRESWGAVEGVVGRRQGKRNGRR